MRPTDDDDRILRKYIRPGLSFEQILEIKSAYGLFDLHGENKVSPKELQLCLLKLGLDVKNSTLYSMLAELENFSKSVIRS